MPAKAGSVGRRRRKQDYTIILTDQSVYENDLDCITRTVGGARIRASLPKAVLLALGQIHRRLSSMGTDALSGKLAYVWPKQKLRIFRVRVHNAAPPRRVRC